MSEVLAVVEGETEQSFVERVLAPHLGLRGVSLRARRVGPVGHKGGVRRPWGSVQDEICDMLRTGSGRRVVHVTTMFDYYGMPESGNRAWPGRSEATNKPHSDKAPAIEAAMHASVCTSLGADFDSALFIPYVQMHELEALIFVDSGSLRYEFVEERDAVARLTASVRGVPPEEVNDSRETAPSKRIEHFLPRYERAKVRVAPQVLGLIGIPALCAACPHFGSWVARLESLAPTTHLR